MNENLNDQDEKMRRIRVAWYRKKIGYVFPLLERAVMMPISLCRVLSVGTGLGEDVEVLTDRGIDSVGVDIVKKKNAPFWLSKGAQYALTDARYLPFKERSFDYILAIEVIEHIGQEKKGTMRKTERKKFARELLRVCRSGGAILLSTPNKKFPIDRAHVGMNRDIVGGTRVGGLRFHSPRESFTLSFEELRQMFNERKDCISLFLVSPLGFIDWNKEEYVKHALTKYVVLPVARLWMKMQDKHSCLRASFLNPHLVLVIKVI